MLARKLHCHISVEELLECYIDMVMYMLKTALKGSSLHYHNYMQRIKTSKKKLQENNSATKPVRKLSL